MKWAETTASDCRWSEYAERIWGDWDILWEDSESDYQGHATILAEKDGKYCFYEWFYGSCSGCDSWEDSGVDIEKEMRDTALWFDNKDQLKVWLDMLDKDPTSHPGDGGLAGSLDILSGGLRDRIDAVRAVFDMPPKFKKK